MKKAPRRGVRSPPRLELSGSEPSHEPQSRSNKPAKKSTPRQPATERTRRAEAAKPEVFVEGMRKEFSAGASNGALLQRGMPAEGAAMVAMEEPARVAANGERPQEKAEAKRPSSRTAATGWTCIIRGKPVARGSSQGRHSQIFFRHTCDRPGCYESFQRSRRSPLQRFCSHECRRALERVLERERRWRERGHGSLTPLRSLEARTASLRL